MIFKNFYLKVTVFLFVIFTNYSLHAQLKLPAVISDGMVLQQKDDVALWGWSSANEKISVKTGWNNKTYQVTADDKGKWFVKVKTEKAGGPFQIKFKTASETITLNDILLGEVWLCSGQSNMEMPLNGFPNEPVLNAEKEKASANFSKIRMFTVPKTTALNRKTDTQGNWKNTTSENVGEFSATAYFFGKNLYEKLNVPIGLIHSSWGGTVAEAWTSEESLRELKDFNSELDRIDSLKPIAEKIREEDLKIQKSWEYLTTHPKEEFYKNSYDFSSWETIAVPSTLASIGLENFDGIVWLKTKLAIPESWKNDDLVVQLGPIDDIDITWFNGEKIGETKKEGFYWAAERKYKIPARLIDKNENFLTVRIVDFIATGGIYGKKNQLKIYRDSSPEDVISIAGEWSFLATESLPKLQLPENANRPSALFNGMLSPIIPYTLKGAIWYQGESNVGRAEQYERLFPKMINDWRQNWDQGDFPFYYAQIAPFSYLGDSRRGAALRDAQRKSLTTANTGMAVLLDIGSATTIHPPNKPEVGRRLSLLALKNTYRKKIKAEGPQVLKSKIEKNKVILKFKHASQITFKEKNNSFELAGKNGIYYPAQVSVKDNIVTLQSKQVDRPVSLRYAYKDLSTASIFNEVGLPLSTFEISIK
ncbi:sialate O-acetylesterase [Mesonia sp.]|uniref:sialate O-acetylesterase n=1 Tax=Mesonia sp. TaxID=1960830 RepID=UPI001761583B|nr:sialate O-acetylesterase [Mesonia sp.]HIB38537.1 hypothetical protein [Mesonia sp.]